MIGAGLAYVALVVREANQVAEVLARDFALPRTDLPIGSGLETAPVFAVGASALALFETGDAYVDDEHQTGVHHIAIAADDPAEAVASWVQAGLGADDRGPLPALGGGTRIGLVREATAGIRTCFARTLELDHGSVGAIERFDHVGVACADNELTVDAFYNRMGFPIESRQTDMEVETVVESFTSNRYGVVYHSRPPRPIAGVRAVFITVGDTELELIENFDPNQGGEVFHGEVGTTRQDQGAIVRFVQSRGSGLHHIAFKVDDIDTALARLAAAGHDLIDAKGRPGGRRSRIGFIHPKSLGGVLAHFVERKEVDSNRRREGVSEGG